MTDTWQDRKAARKARFDREHGVKMISCTACSGSGHYDAGGSPPCGACGGTGKVRDRKPDPTKSKS